MVKMQRSLMAMAAWQRCTGWVTYSACVDQEPIGALAVGWHLIFDFLWRVREYQLAGNGDIYL